MNRRSFLGSILAAPVVRLPAPVAATAVATEALVSQPIITITQVVGPWLTSAQAARLIAENIARVQWNRL